MCAVISICIACCMLHAALECATLFKNNASRDIIDALAGILLCPYSPPLPLLLRRARPAHLQNIYPMSTVALHS